MEYEVHSKYYVLLGGIVFELPRRIGTSPVDPSSPQKQTTTRQDSHQLQYLKHITPQIRTYSVRHRNSNMVAIVMKKERRVFRAGNRLNRIKRSRPTADQLRQRAPVKRISISAVKLADRITNDRTFNIRKHGSQVIEDVASGLRRLESDPESLIVAIKGTCRRNGLEGAQAGYGIFFASSTQDLNTRGLVPVSSPQTSQYASLFATMRALDIIHQLMIAGEDLSHVVFKTDSDYIAKGLSRFVWKWQSNGYKNFKGQPVVNGRAFKYLHERVDLLEREYRIRVSFCLVGKEFNLQADQLAHGSLMV